MDSSGGPLAGAVLFFIMLLIDFILAGFGSALQAVSESVLEQSGKETDRKDEQILAWKDNPRKLIYACWFYQVLSAVAGSYLLLAAFSGPVWAILLTVMVLIYLFGKAVPRLLGMKFAAGWCRQMFSVAQFLVKLSFPFTCVLSVITHLIGRIFGIDSRHMEEEVTEDEIISMVNEGHEQGVLDEHEAEMIQNIFELDDKEAQDIMTHRKNISGISGSVNLADAISFMVEETNSRFPVYEGDIDNIIGVLHFKDAMIFHNKKQYDNWLIKDIPELLRPVRFIPETRGINTLFRSMQAEKLQMVIVVDEYGETAGLVTMEDILEEIVGNILDEYDEDERFILPEPDGSWRMAGMTPLQDVEEALEIDFEEDDYDTLSGYLVYRLDRIPEQDEQSVIGEQGYSFQILEVENKTIKWVKVTRIRETKPDSGGLSDELAEKKKEATTERE